MKRNLMLNGDRTTANGAIIAKPTTIRFKGNSPNLTSSLIGTMPHRRENA